MMGRRRKKVDVPPPAPHPATLPSAGPIIGHEAVLQKLRVYHEQGLQGLTMLWVGPEAVGKRTVALRFAQGRLCERGAFLGCGTCWACERVQRGQHPDLTVYVVEPTQVHPIERVWQFREQMVLKPWYGRVRFFIWDQAERMRKEAANAMLKTLEEPSGSAVVILVTGQVYRILPTIRSRTQILRFGTVSEEILVALLLRQPGWSEAEARWVVRFSGGRPGMVLRPRAFWEFHRRVRRVVLEWFQQWLADPRQGWGAYWAMDFRTLTALAEEVFGVVGEMYTQDAWVWHRWWLGQVLTHGLVLLRDLFWLQRGLPELVVSVDLVGALERMVTWVEAAWLMACMERWMQFLSELETYHWTGAWQMPGWLVAGP